LSESKSINAATPVRRAAQRWNVVWVVPILAVLIGAWLLYKDVSSKGPTVTIRFETADGIVAGKTELRCRSVTVGKVTKVELGKDLKSVVVYCSVDAGNEDLLRNDARFWVVRPRVSAADVSGLDTLLTGNYIELDPGKKGERVESWVGLENPPVTSLSVPGRRLRLVSVEARSLVTGSPVYYRGYEVGRVESRTLDADGRRVSYDVFIDEKHQDLVRRNTKFWNTSGIDISSGVDGFKIRTPSLQALVSGGVSFGIPEGLPPAKISEDGDVFVLHQDAETAASSNFEPTMQILLLFDQTVRGLKKGAPVEYRGITIGRVRNFSFDYVPERNNQKIPVLVEVDPKLLRASGNDDGPDEELTRLNREVKKGLRGTLKTGSLLTGALFVDFDYYPEELPAELTYQKEFPVVPTLSSGFGQLEQKLASVLDKLNSLPLAATLEKITLAADETAITVADARGAVKQMELAAKAARETMDNPEFQKLPADLRKSIKELETSLASLGPSGTMQGDLLRTLDEFRSAMRSMEALSDTIKEKPNSIFFGKEGSKDPRPKAAGSRRYDYETNLSHYYLRAGAWQL